MKQFIDHKYYNYFLKQFFGEELKKNKEVITTEEKSSLFNNKKVQETMFANQNK